MKSIFVRILNLVRNPQGEWKSILRDYEDVASVRKNFFFPCLLFVLLMFVIDCFIRFDWAAMQNFSDFLSYSAKRLVVSFSALFAGVYFSTLLLSRLLNSKFWDGNEHNFYESFVLVVFCSSTMWMLNLIQMFIPSFFFLPILNIYVMYLVWCALPSFFPTMNEDNKKGIFTAVAFLLMFLCPIAVEKILLNLMS